MRNLQASGDADITDLLGKVSAPTLVMHAREEVRVPFESGRRMAAAIPGARFVALQSRNHLILEDEPAYPHFREEIGPTAVDRCCRQCRPLGEDNRLPTHARVRAFLEGAAKRRILITYQELAKALNILPPHSIHQVTEALERLMEEDAAVDRPFIAALAISKTRDGLPAPGFFDCAGRLGRFADGQDTRTFHAAELNAVFARWGCSRNK